MNYGKYKNKLRKNWKHWKNGIELYFETIPTTEERRILKENSYKWNNQKKCWYIKKDKTKETTKEKFKYKEIQPATQEQIEKAVCKLWKREDMQEYMKKSYDFYILKDGYILTIDKASKISMSTTIWYDDETEGPDNNENTFISYNMNLHNPARNLENYLSEKERLLKHSGATGLYDYKNIYICTHYYDSKDFVFYNFLDEKDKNFIRYLSDEEEKELLQLIKEQKEKYLERLQKYYKRFKKYVNVCGYWRDR